MKILSKILIFLTFLGGLILLIYLDYVDRNRIYSKFIPNEFTHINKTVDEVQQVYKRHFHDPNFIFPRGNVEKVIIYRNIPLIGRFNGKVIEKKEILDFVNNSENFDWTETTWNNRKSEYIIRFYDFENKQIGIIRVCEIDTCGMTESTPFVPTMKFGGLSKIGRNKLSQIVNDAFR